MACSFEHKRKNIRVDKTAWSAKRAVSERLQCLTCGLVPIGCLIWWDIVCVHAMRDLSAHHSSRWS